MKFLWSALIFAALHCNIIVFGQETYNSENDNCCEEYCYSKDPDKSQTRQYATKTAYDVAKGSDSSVNYKIAGCIQEKVWIMIRHGARWPTVKDIQEMRNLEDLRVEVIRNYEERKTQPSTGALCMDDKFSIKTWKLSKNLSTDSFAEKLAPQGYQDMKLIARNYRRFLPEIFEPIDERNFDFRYTPTQRTQESFKAFAEGILQRAPDVGPQPEVDPVLNPYAGCDRWEEQNKNDKSNNASEYNIFINSEIMKDTVRRISRRLGFKFALSRAQIDTVWDMCRFEQAWHPNRNSPWCAAFTPEHVTVLEYAEDLRNYYKVGYGNELNSRIACSAVQDMVRHLNNSNEPHIAAYFTHSANIQLLLTALGIAKDRDALRANNFHDMKNRNWKSSELAPFASNFAAIKYSCEGGNEKRVMFVLNQKTVDLDWCKVGLCNWGDALVTLDRFTKADCSQYYCSENSSTNIQSSFLVLILTLIIYFINGY
ncbi:multiple inositol polyphosphate phosphatase 1 [Condylostylus longicornis]|uniref:multiple inositol polyphosphate phosphatase 1 n=1 Tax=Condylostylus longicornis TaxID=2530218 RepID=UPI00244E4009|nr:multiple inositol polyphosphate phosphatase 1 [Condylostylus longicornis]XP_055378735.1 multiple inositol polyphosphate phosphatase 1 [Condylostylus longicornis]